MSCGIRNPRARLCGCDSIAAALVVEIEDDGVGYPKRQHHGLGLVSMRERADLVNGTIEFVQGKSGGALVRATVPHRFNRRDMPQTDITVLLVDDHSLVRHGFRRMLEDEPGISVVGEASDGFEAVESADRAAAAGYCDGFRAAQHEWRGGDAANSGCASR